jgi:hypothetical protein
VWTVELADKTLRMAATDFVALTKARSMLVILLATCRQTLLALDAAGNALDIDLTEDLRRMIARSETELETLNQKLKGTG